MSDWDSLFAKADGYQPYECLRCHALVAGQARPAHDQWHNGLVFAIESAARHTEDTP